MSALELSLIRFTALKVSDDLYCITTRTFKEQLTIRFELMLYIKDNSPYTISFAHNVVLRYKLPNLYPLGHVIVQYVKKKLLKLTGEFNDTKLH